MTYGWIAGLRGWHLWSRAGRQGVTSLTVPDARRIEGYGRGLELR